MVFQERLLMRKIKKSTQHKSDLYKSKKREREEPELTNEVKEESAFDEEQPEQKRIKLDDDIPIESVENECKKESTEIEVNNTDTEEQKLPFDSLGLCDKTSKAIADMGFTTMTEIQAKTIPSLLTGKHLVGEAKTGSGKTLAFLIPVVEWMHKLSCKPRNGTVAVVLSPTRELSMQTFGVLKALMKYHSHTHALIIGGADKKLEGEKLRSGVNIVIATPGRLLYHLKTTTGFKFDNLSFLVIDEMDKMMNMGFMREMNEIISIIPKFRQTIMFTATRTQKTDELTNLAVEQAMYVSTKVVGVADNIIHSYMVCPSEKRLIALYTILKSYLIDGKKVMVFFNSCASVIFHHKLFNYIDLEVMCIHGQLKRNQRTTSFFQFCRAKSGILLCTDIASRGLDFPAVDWIIHYDPPNDPKDYVHRTGRTARGEESTGNSMVMLREEELGFWRIMKLAAKDCEILRLAPPPHDSDKEKWIQRVVGKNFKLKAYAIEAYNGYMKAYETHVLKKWVFDSSKLNLNTVAKSFGLRFVPGNNSDSKRRVPNRRERRLNERERGDKNHKFKENGIKNNFKEANSSELPKRMNRRERRKDILENGGAEDTNENKTFFMKG